MPMTVQQLLEEIKKLPIDMLDKDVCVGKAVENYPYGPDYENVEKAHSFVRESNRIIIYSV